MAPKIISTLTLDHTEFSDDTLKQFEETFQKIGYYLGDIFVDYWGENDCDTYCLYVCKRKLNKRELADAFGPMLEDYKEETVGIQKFLMEYLNEKKRKALSKSKKSNNRVSL